MMKDCDDFYIDEAMKNLGECFDYAVNVCHYDADDFMDLFIASGISEQFEKINPKYVSGMSGTELAMEVFDITGVHDLIRKPQVEYGCSSVYWAGWVLAYYQHRRETTFKNIHNCISVNDIIKMYSTLHEASEDKFVDVLDDIIEGKKGVSKLQKQRKICGYSQRELAVKSGVNLRTLQQYELGTKDISKASVRIVLALANALGCSVETFL